MIIMIIITCFFRATNASIMWTIKCQTQEYLENACNLIRNIGFYEFENMSIHYMLCFLENNINFIVIF